MAEQRRQTFANRIHRAEFQIMSEKMNEEQSIELNERMEMLKEAFQTSKSMMHFMPASTINIKHQFFVCGD